jgi:hypothetical protein
MRKYLDRFDTMMYMSAELARSKRIINPTQADLVDTVGKDYLEIDTHGQNTSGEPKKKGRPRRIRGEDGLGNVNTGEVVEKKGKVGRPRKIDSGQMSATPQPSYRGGGGARGQSQPRAGSYSTGPDGEELGTPTTGVKRKQKPGPRKGWKNGMPPPGGFGKKMKLGSGAAAGVKAEM